MKKLRIKITLALIAFGIITIIACSKTFLNRPPQGALNPGVLTNATGVQTILVGAYHSMLGETNWGSAPSNWTFGSVVGGDAYKGSTPSDQGDIENLEDYSYLTDNPYIDQKFLAVYHGVQKANDVLRTIPLAKDLSAADVTQYTAEARFLRGYWHLEAKKMWKNVPYVDENVGKDSANGVTNLDASGNYVDIYPQIEADFTFAMSNLPDHYSGMPGRANKWAAAAFLAKTYMFEHKYSDAKTLFDQIIASGVTSNGDKYALNQHFEANFNAATDNSPESVFAVQCSVNDGSGTNGNYGDNLNFPYGGGPGACCGFLNPSISLANSYKTDPVTGLPLFATFNTGKNVSDPSGAYVGTLDPRLDWTVGRQGIPYLDWGPHPGTAWVRDPSTDGWMSPKKNVYAQSQAGSESSTETSFWGPTQMDANNVNLIRYSDVLLMAAECETQIGSLDQAETYVNMVRNRAADPTGWVYKNSAYSASTGTYTVNATPADNYFIKPYPVGAFSTNGQAYALQAIYFERKLELAMEGNRFFDLQRWDGQNGFSMAAELNAFIAAEKTRPGYFSFATSATFTAGKNEIYPLPLSEIDVQNAKGKVLLKQNPGY